MAFSPEQLKAYEDNLAFHEAFKDALRRIVAPLPFLRTLDYGAGAHFYSLFAGLHSEEQITAFDPSLDITRRSPIFPGENPVYWVNFELPGFFELVICHFTIHHMDQSPRHIFGQFRFMHPRFVAVAEYDYTRASKEEFRRTFVADKERSELRTVFEGDIESCFRFHANPLLSRTRYGEAFVQNGYQIVAEGTGKGVARHKFYIIGQTPGK